MVSIACGTWFRLINSIDLNRILCPFNGGPPRYIPATLESMIAGTPDMPEVVEHAISNSELFMLLIVPGERTKPLNSERLG